MLLQSPLVTESFVLPAEPTEVLDLGGVGGAVLQSDVALYLSVPAAQTVPAALETGHGCQALRDDDQRLRLAGAHPVLLLHVSHGQGLEGENLTLLIFLLREEKCPWWGGEPVTVISF